MLSNFIRSSPCFEFGAAACETVAISCNETCQTQAGKIRPLHARRTALCEIDTCNIFLSFARFAGARPWRAAPTSSRPLALLELLTPRALVASGLLALGSEIFEFLHLANLKHFVVRSGAALSPFNRLSL